MRRSTIQGTVGALALASVLVACQAPSLPKPQPGAKPAASLRPKAVEPGAGPSAVEPGASPNAGEPGTSPNALTASQAPNPAIPPGTSAAPPPRLVAPASGTFALAGHVRIDATYALAAGAGRLTGGAGGEALALAEAALIANNGSTLVANNGGTLVANNGGTLVANNGSTLVANNGSTLVANNAGNLIANNGSTVLARWGAGLLPAGAAGYALAEAPGSASPAGSAPPSAAATGAALAAGTILPAAGMLVGAVDLATGQLLPVGEDGSGKPVYGVYSDAAGGYALYLPERLKNSVVVVAVPPTAAVDGRLAYELITAKGAEGDVMDEDSAIATRITRRAMEIQLAKLLATADLDATIEDLGGLYPLTPGVKAITRTVIGTLNEEAAKVGLRGAPLDQVLPVSRRICDIVASRLSPPDLLVSTEITTQWDGPPARVIQTLVAIMQEVRERATVKLREDPAYFEKQAYVKAANAARAPLPPLVIRKPADLNQFLVDAYLPMPETAYDNTRAVFNDIGVGQRSSRTSNTTALRMSACNRAIVYAGILAIATNQEGALDLAIAEVQRRGARP